MRPEGGGVYSGVAGGEGGVAGIDLASDGGSGGCVEAVCAGAAACDGHILCVAESFQKF